MKTWILALTLLCSLTLHAQAPATATTAPTTTEAQAVVDALVQSKDHVWSIYLLGMAQLVAALVTLALLFNLRSLAFLFLIFYGTLVLSVPFYIPTSFQTTFGIAIVLMAFVGLITRLMLFKREPRARATPAPGVPSENNSQIS